MMRYSKLYIDLIVWVGLCVSVTYWAIPWLQPTTPSFMGATTPSITQEKEGMTADALFSGRTTVSVASGNYSLRGVLVSNDARESVAIVSIDNKPAQAIKAGTEIMPGIIMQEIRRDHVLISEQGAVRQLMLPQEKNISGIKPNSSF